ncbi:hypothetical protein HK100_007891 [Physocladia obscura]|uniref:GYF domain-containing protein n=1 Tax=Physocladia obscura TaxID=109957 RepID=A0AAD5XES1_9FUNG|nr:hypothetical protein HK100_007891 [Physocladia obscura]
MKRSSNESTNKHKKVKFAGDNSYSNSRNTEFIAADGQDDEDLEYGTKKRRGAVKAGYTDSDDETGAFDSDDEDKKSDTDANNDNGDDDHDKQSGKGKLRVTNAGTEDMFAENNNVDSPDTNSISINGIRYLSKDKVDQEGAEGDGADDLELGVRIEPFNMDQELEEGGFDENYNYIKTLDEHGVHDKWLGGITASEIKKAKAASDRLKARTKAMDDAFDDIYGDDENACWKLVLRLMKPKETVVASLQRLGGPKKVPAWKRNQKKKGSSSSAPAAFDETPEAEQERKKVLAELISITDKLTELGRYDVMEQTYESIVRNLRIAGLLSDGWQHGDLVPLPETSSKLSNDANAAAAQKILWEYKFGKDSEDLKGPYPAPQMREWKESNFFSDATDTWVRLVKVSGTTSLDPVKNFVPISYVNLDTGEGAPVS